MGKKKKIDPTGKCPDCGWRISDSGHYYGCEFEKAIAAMDQVETFNGPYGCMPSSTGANDFINPMFPLIGPKPNEVRVVDPKTGGMKGQKSVQFSLMPPEALEEIAKVYAFGAEKYSRNNWRLGYDWHLSYDAMMRHLNAFWGGEDLDPESGLPHLAHAGFHMMTLLTYMKIGKGTDDRQ